MSATGEVAAGDVAVVVYRRATRTPPPGCTWKGTCVEGGSASREGAHTHTLTRRRADFWPALPAVVYMSLGSLRMRL